MPRSALPATSTHLGRSMAWLCLLFAGWLSAAMHAQAATPISLDLIDGSDLAPYSAVGEATGTIASPGTSVTLSVSVEAGLIYGVQLAKGTLDAAVMALDGGTLTSGTLLEVAASGGTREWFHCSRNGSLLISVASSTGTLASADAATTGDFAVRVLRTSAMAITGVVSNAHSDPLAGMDVRSFPADHAYGDGAWPIDAAPAQTTRSDGSYGLVVPQGWSGHVVAGGETLRLPLAHTYTNLRDDLPVQNYDFTTTTISGKVTLAANGALFPGVTITATRDGQSSTTLTTSNGKWRLIVPKRWTGTLTASIQTSSTQFSFLPTEIDITDKDWATSGTLGGRNFTATPLVRLSGTLKLDSSAVNAPVSGVKVYLTDGSVTQTRPDGTFRFYVASGWSGYVYTHGKAGEYFVAPPALAVSQVTENTQLTAFVLKQYESLDHYYAVTLNTMTPESNPAQFRITTATIAVANVDPATDMLKIRRKLGVNGKALDYPPIANLVISASALTSASGPIAATGGLKSLYTEGTIEALAAGGSLGKVAAVGCHITRIEIGGTVGSVAMSSNKGTGAVASVVAHGTPASPTQKGTVSLSGVTLGGLFAPEQTFSSVKAAGKKVAPVAGKTAIWLPGNIDAPGQWNADLERQYRNGRIERDAIALCARQVGSLSVSEGCALIGSMAGAFPRIAATGSKDNDGSVAIGWMDNTATGKIAVATKGGRLGPGRRLPGGRRHIEPRREAGGLPHRQQAELRRPCERGARDNRSGGHGSGCGRPDAGQRDGQGRHRQHRRRTGRVDRGRRFRRFVRPPQGDRASALLRDDQPGGDSGGQQHRRFVLCQWVQGAQEAPRLLARARRHAEAGGLDRDAAAALQCLVLGPDCALTGAGSRGRSREIAVEIERRFGVKWWKREKGRRNLSCEKRACGRRCWQRCWPSRCRRPRSVAEARPTAASWLPKSWIGCGTTRRKSCRRAMSKR